MSWKDKLTKTKKRLARKKAFKMEEGKNTIRLLPSRNAVLQAKKDRNWDDALGAHAPYLVFLAHRDVGPEKRFVRSGKDPDGGGDCWLTDVVIPALLKSKNSSDRAAGQAMVPQEQFCVQVSTMDRDGEWTDPAVWYVPRSLQDQVMDLLLSTHCQYDHPSKGKNLHVTRTGTQMQTRYGAVQLDHEPSKFPTALLSGLISWSDVVKDYSEADQREAFGDDAPDCEDDEEQPERPKRKAVKKKRRVPDPEPEDEDDDFLEEEDEDVEDEDEAEADDEDVDDDEAEAEDAEDEDEEPEPAPKKKAKKKAAKGRGKAKRAPKKPVDDDEEDIDDDDLPF